jgi:NAD-dependent dihydropyrimidine dehydrogenase PreA subunit
VRVQHREQNAWKTHKAPQASENDSAHVSARFYYCVGLVCGACAFACAVAIISRACSVAPLLIFLSGCRPSAGLDLLPLLGSTAQHMMLVEAKTGHGRSGRTDTERSTLSERAFEALTKHARGGPNPKHQ